MGIYGVAAASIVAVIMETILHYAALYRSIGSCFQFKDVAKIIGLGIIAGAFGKFTFDTLLMYPVSLQLAALIAILVLLFIYFALIFITNTVRWSAVWITLKRR